MASGAAPEVAADCYIARIKRAVALARSRTVKPDDRSSASGSQMKRTRVAADEKLRTPGKREPGGSLMVYGGGERGRRLLEMTDDRIREEFLRDLYTVLPQTKGIVREVIIQRWEKAIPYASPGRHRLQAALDRPLGRVFLAGDYLEYPEMEAAAATGREAAREVRRRLTAA